jgi:outer membrane protein assembly factor BamB
MASVPQGSHGSKVVRAIILGLVVILVCLLAFPSLRDYVRAWFDSEKYQADAERLQKLGSAALPTTAPKADSNDWPQWRGRDRDGVSAEKGLRFDWPKDGPPLLWKVKGGAGYSSFAVAGGRAYTMFQDGDNEVIVCLDGKNGAETWRYPYPARFHEAQAGTGPHGTPAVYDGRVYAVGSTGRFHCLDALSGKVLWEHDLPKEFQAPIPVWGISFSPLIEGDLVITQPGGNGSSVAAFDRRDGTLKWKSQNAGTTYSSPMAATLAGKRQLVCFTNEALLGLAPADGALYWKYPWPTEPPVNAATPIVVGDYVFISSGYGKGCALLEIGPGDGGKLEAKRVYEHNRLRTQFSSSVLYGEHIYGFDEKFLVCMDLRTGKVRWKERGFERGSLLAADGHLIVLAEYGSKLAAVEATPEAYREKGSFKFSSGTCWAMPALASGKLFVRDEESVFCFNLRPE